MSIRLILPGRTVVSNQEPVTNRFHKIESRREKLVDSASRGAVETTEEFDCDPDALLELTFADGTRQWISAAALREDLHRNDPSSQTERGTRVQLQLAADRGVGGAVLKALKILKVDPVDAVSGQATKAVIAHFEKKVLPQQGLFLYPAPDRIAAAAKPPATEPLLIFLHGTMSSTTGSFGKFAGTDEWTRLSGRYPGRILAFEHATLSQSPIQNAIELATSLPAGATLHLVSHSRGGLIGELLSLKPDQDDEKLCAAFEGRQADAEAIRKLMVLLNQKKFKVERFVRVACPARGTTLASKRLDLYLSAFSNLIEFVPLARDSVALDFVRAVTQEIAKRRTDPKELPGIEAMMPDSPLIRMLNTVAKSDGDLAVIAGDAQGDGFLGRLKNLAIDAFFLEKNDFVVNTDAMYGGIVRGTARPPRVFDQGPSVNHFQYFANQKTRAKIVACLESGAIQAGFDRAFVPKFAVDLLTTFRTKTPIVYLLPGIMGSHIQIDKDRIWVDPASLALGGLKRMAALDKGGADGILNSFYGALSTRLLKDFNVREFAYDWRNSLKAAAEKLGDKVTEDLDKTKEPISFLAHSMGGLVVRAMIAYQPKVWAKVTARGGRLVMLGTPNNGSYAVAMTLAGQNPLVGMLGKVDIKNSEEQLRDVIRGFPGLLELMSDGLFSPAAWQDRPGVAAPDTALLDKAKAVRDKIRDAVDPDAMVYVAGTGATADGWETKDGKVVFRSNPDGDGTVTHESGKLPGVRTWYVDASHGNLANKLSAYDGYIDLLHGGTTNKLQEQPIRSRGRAVAVPATVPVLIPMPEDLEAAALGATAPAPSPDHENKLTVSVVHGDLRYADLPVAVGHYAGDTIVNAEGALDHALGGELSRRFRIGLYPGAEGTAEVIPVANSKPAGALVIGLGQVGEVTFDKVRNGIATAALRLALESAKRGDREIAFASLLIGTFGGRSSLSLEQSVRAIVTGVLQANRMLSEQARPTISRLELLELYGDSANQAADVLDRLTQDLPLEQPGVRLTMSPRYLQVLEGGRSLRPGNDYATGWWRRIQVTRTPPNGVRPLEHDQLMALLKRAGSSAQPEAAEQFVSDLLRGSLTAQAPRGTNLKFLALTDRARAEERSLTIQTSLVDGFVAELVGSYEANSQFGRTLFDLLLPADFKTDIAAQSDLVLVLDRGAAQYPWEMLAVTRGAETKSIALEKGLIRQFKTDQFRLRPRGGAGRMALVLGDPKNDLFQLPGAASEARLVTATLEKYEFKVRDAYQPTGLQAVQLLFQEEYRIVHIAGHGMYDPDDPINSGVLLDGGRKITPAEIQSLEVVPELVFLNCCHLGRVDQEKVRERKNFNELAASVAEELIKIGVHAVVAAGWAVNDAAAATFAQTFYGHLLEGKTFGVAVKLARQATAAQHPDTNTWGAYQCYGNPDFVINGGAPSRVATPLHFYSRSQALDHLATLTGRIKQAADDQTREKRASDLRETEAAMPDHWKDGEMLAALALRWSELKRRNEAMRLFERALEAEESSAPFHAAEKLANAQARLAADMAQEDWPRAKSLLNTAIKSLNRLIEQAKTPERYSLLGSAHKRYALALAGQKQPAAGPIQTRLAAAAEAYGHAWALCKRKDRLDAYSGLNKAACQALEKKLDKKKLLEFLEELQAGIAQRSPSVDRNVWDRVAAPDALVVFHLAKGDVAAQQNAIVQAYKVEFPRGITPGELDSVLTQLVFLEKMLRILKQPQANAMQEIVDALKKP